jgi:uncharacterized protein (DUF1800 family)
MATTQYPLEEKLTLYWHGHFATSFHKNGLAGAMLTQNRMLRENAAGDFRQMCYLVTADVAMLYWLDNAWNRVGHTNENYARELMELFTLGRDNYTQTDVTEVARAMTGYQVSGYSAKFNPLWHDQGLKTILGNGPANFGPTDVIDLILDHHPQGHIAAQYVAQRLASFIHRPNPSATLVQAMAQSFTGAARQPYPIKSMLRTLLMSSDFMNDTLVGIKSPAEFVAGAIAQLSMASDPTVGLNTSSSTEWADASASMGQELFAPPNVAGWKGGAAWANTAGALARYNFAARLASETNASTVQSVLDQANNVPRSTAGPWMNRLGLVSLSAQTQQGLDQYVKAATAAKDSAATITRGVLTLLLASPDYMLR